MLGNRGSIKTTEAKAYEELSLQNDDKNYRETARRERWGRKVAHPRNSWAIS